MTTATHRPARRADAASAGSRAERVVKGTSGRRPLPLPRFAGERPRAWRRPPSLAYKACSNAGVTSRGRRGRTSPARRACRRCAGTTSSARSTACSEATSVRAGRPRSARPARRTRGVGQRRVERRHRLVGQQQGGAAGTAPAPCHALQLATREAIAAVEQPVGQRQARQRLVRPAQCRRDAAATTGPCPPTIARAARPARRSPRAGAAAAAAPGARRRCGRAGFRKAPEPQLPRRRAEQFDLPFGGPQRRTGDPQQRRLARARRADERDLRRRRCDRQRHPAAAPAGPWDAPRRRPDRRKRHHAAPVT